jgi:hypothetical protein
MADADVQGTHYEVKQGNKRRPIISPPLSSMIHRPITKVVMLGAVLMIGSRLSLDKPQLRSRIDVEAIKGMVWGFIGIAPFLPLVVEGVA